MPLGTQVCVPARGGLPPHLAFVPYKQPPDGGHPVLVFLHGSGESAPTPLRRGPQLSGIMLTASARRATGRRSVDGIVSACL